MHGFLQVMISMCLMNDYISAVMANNPAVPCCGPPVQLLLPVSICYPFHMIKVLVRS